MYAWKQWQDHVTEFPDRYRETPNSDGTITHTPDEGDVIQQGTPQNAANFNHMEDGISNAGELAALLALHAIHMGQQLADMEGETMQVTLTNTQSYPFNNSKKTLALSQKRNHLNYTVTAEVLEYSGGFPGDIVVSEKLLNGFKIEHTGSATSVKLKIYVKGGFY